MAWVAGRGVPSGRDVAAERQLGAHDRGAAAQQRWQRRSGTSRCTLRVGEHAADKRVAAAGWCLGP